MATKLDIFNSGIIRTAIRFDQQLSDLRNLNTQKELLFNLSGAQARQIKAETDSQIEQLTYQQEQAVHNRRIVQDSSNIERRNLEQEITRADQVFGDNLGILRAQAAARNIDLGAGFLDAQNEIVDRFNKEQFVKQTNLNLVKRIQKNKYIIADIEVSAIGAKIRTAKEVGSAQLDALAARTAAQNANIDASIRSIAIERKYASDIGVGKFIGAATNNLGLKVSAGGLV